MSIIAGYTSRRGRLWPSAGFRKLVEGYRILPSEHRSDLQTDIKETRFGHLISQYKRGYRHQMPTVVDQDGNILMTAGYILPRDSEGPEACSRLLSLCVETQGRALEECEGEFVSVFYEGPSEPVARGPDGDPVQILGYEDDDGLARLLGVVLTNLVEEEDRPTRSRCPIVELPLGGVEEGALGHGAPDSRGFAAGLSTRGRA